METEGLNMSDAESWWLKLRVFVVETATGSTGPSRTYCRAVFVVRKDANDFVERLRLEQGITDRESRGQVGYVSRFWEVMSERELRLREQATDYG